MAHPRADALIEDALGPGADDCLVAVGPEGGWIERELDTFVDRGFTPVSLGPRILRVETAVPVLLSRLTPLIFPN